MENTRKKIVTQCLICKAINLDGTMVQKGNYPLFDGLVFQGTILSRACGERYYGKDFADNLTFIRENCRH